VCGTKFKSVRREAGIAKWPYRQVRPRLLVPRVRRRARSSSPPPSLPAFDHPYSAPQLNSLIKVARKLRGDKAKVAPGDDDMESTIQDEIDEASHWAGGLGCCCCVLRCGCDDDDDADATSPPFPTDTIRATGKLPNGCHLNGLLNAKRRKREKMSTSRKRSKKEAQSSRKRSKKEAQSPPPRDAGERAVQQDAAPSPRSPRRVLAAACAGPPAPPLVF